MFLRLTMITAAISGIGLASAVLVLALEPRAQPGHNRGHIGCKHGHGSTWLKNHSRRGRTGSPDTEDERDAPPAGLRPFTAFAR